MTAIKIATGEGGTVTLEESTIDKLKSSLKGSVLCKGDDGYDEARSIWNAMIDRHPAMIVRCLNQDDVQNAVALASEHGLLTAIRGGGHNIAGNAICDDGLIIDLSQMTAVRVDRDAKRAHVEPGATLGDLDQETLKYGLATPVGINSTTGVAGLTLGGGFGWLSRKLGMTVDNLVAADIVTANGDFLTVDEKNHPDLFWAIRGGGGNFGVVTRFEFQLHPVGPELFSGLIVLPLKEAVPALKQLREYAKKLGDETSIWAVLRQAPPLPFLPEEVHGTEVLVFAFCHAGDPEEGQKAIEPVRKFGTVLGEHFGAQPYVTWQTAFDPLLTPGARNYWKSHNFAELSDEAIQIGVEYAGKLPSSECEIFFAMLGGAVKRVPAAATAYPHRDADYVLNVHGRWQDAADDEKCIGWARDFFNASAPHATGGVYINFMTSDETDRVKAAYGPSYERLAKVKAQYDPGNLFRLNQNITPKA